MFSSIEGKDNIIGGNMRMLFVFSTEVEPTLLIDWVVYVPACPGFSEAHASSSRARVRLE